MRQRLLKDVLPKNATFVLVWGSHTMWWLAEFIDGKFKDIEDGETLTDITHWMKLPKPPK